MQKTKKKNRLINCKANEQGERIYKRIEIAKL